MTKDKAILLIIISLLVGFLAGAITGILYATKDSPKPSVQQQAQVSEGDEPLEATKVVPTEEIRALEGIVKTEPNNLKALVSLGNLYFDAGQHQKAVDSYQRALKIDPKNSDVRTDMAIMYRTMKNYDAAIKELREAAAQNPSHVNSRYNLGVVLLHDKKDYKGAVTVWEEYLKLEPTGERADTIRQRLQQLKSMAK